MTVHLVTFASKEMERSSWLCATSSKEHGVDTHARFTPANIGTWKEIKQHPYLFIERRGCGYWAWKPLIIKREMEWLPEGTTLIYSDAGVEFINNVSHIIARMDQDIFLFGNNWEHAHWCKRDIVEAIWPVEQDASSTFSYPVSVPHNRDADTWARFGKQCQASVIFFRVSDYSKQFVAEWLKWCLHRVRHSTICTDEWRYLIDDSPSITPNHPEFRENRHDQAILTTLAYREGIKLHYWPASYNDGAFVYEKLPEYAGDDYPVLFSHHRKRDHEWEQVA
jgi:hypothetical protein